MSPAETQQAAQTVTTQEEAASLLDQVIKVTRPQDEREADGREDEEAHKKREEGVRNDPSDSAK